MLPPTTHASRYWPLLMLVIIALIIGIGEHLQAPPAATTGTIADDDFSVQRALQHVQVIASQPHPSGSAANAEVRDYLVATLRSYGAEVEVQRRLQSYEYEARAGLARVAYVENVLARWPGQQAGPALLLMAHYDSMPSGPGAGDDASGVATILETMRALAASGLPTRNPLMVAFTDAEELGLIGAQAFFGHHPWAEQVGLVLNFDARGSRGAAFMYETSPNNGALIDALVDSVKAPSSNSLVYSIFKHMPNDTDMSIAKAAGVPGMNFAFIDGFYDYHSPTDRPERLSLDTLGQFGGYALPLARHFGGTVLPPEPQADRHYFNPLGHTLVSYPPWLDWLIWLLAAALLSAAGLRAIRRDALRVSTLIRGVAVALLVLLVPALLVLLLDRWLDQAMGLSEVIARQRSWFTAWAALATGSALWVQASARKGLGWLPAAVATLVLTGLAIAAGGWAFPLVALAVGAALALLLRRPLPAEAMFAGGLVLLVLLALAAMLLLAGGAYVLLWPLLTIGLLQAWRERGDRSVASAIWMLAAVPAVLLLGSTALTFDLMVGYALPVVSVLPLLMLLLFTLPIAVPAESVESAESARVTGVAVAALGAIGLAWLGLSAPWSAEQPQQRGLFVLHDGDQQRSYWASSDRDVSAWHRQLLGQNPKQARSSLYLPTTDNALLLAPLQPTLTVGPTVEVLSADPKQRRLRLRLRPDRGGDMLAVWLPPLTDLRGWQADGQSLPWSADDLDGWRALGAYAVPAEGIELTLELGPGEHWPELLLTSRSNGLPDGLSLPPRGPTEMRRVDAESDVTITFRHVAIGPLLGAGAVIAP